MQKSSSKKEIIVIILVAISIAHILSLISHSNTENPFSGGVSLDSTDNYLGMFGAYIADFSLSLIGFSAYLIALSLIVLAVRYYQGICTGINNWMFVIKSLVFMIFIANSSALLSLITPYYGGYLGESINSYIVPLFATGAWLIYVMLEFVFISILTHLSWLNLAKALLTGGVWLANNIYYASRYLANISRAVWQRIKRKPRTTPPIRPQHNLTPKTRTVPKVTAKVVSHPSPKSTTAPTTHSHSMTEEGVLPGVELLDTAPENNISYSADELGTMAENLSNELANFGINATVVDIVPGPVITSFEIELPAGIKASKVVSLEKDLARALLVESVRIVDVIPGKHTIGIEIPNAVRQMITLSEIINSDAYVHSHAPLTMCLGKNTSGQEVIMNLAKTPHLLVAGATGMGKSVGLNAMLMGILFKSKPHEVRLIMIDPKVVELAIYADIPHLLTPVVTDMHLASSVLFWCVGEMERRYALLAKYGVRNIAGFNEKVREAKAKGEPLLDEEFDAASAAEGASAPELEELPLIVIVIDEYADMLGALAQEDRSKAKRTESFIIRIAQKARAAGMHLIIATQRPSVDVITGLIKSNIPTRVAFKVSSRIDSRTILDSGGAENLLGMGDMLYTMPGHSVRRVHGAFVSDGEIARTTQFLKEHYPTNYVDSILHAYEESEVGDSEVSGASASGEADPLYDEAVEVVLSSGKASISSVQRRLRIGYNRAARIIEDMEAAGLVSPMNANGSREILAPRN